MKKKYCAGKCSVRKRLHSTLVNVCSVRLAFSEIKPHHHTELPHTYVHSPWMTFRIHEFSSFSFSSESHIPAVCNASLKGRRAVWCRTLADLD